MKKKAIIISVCIVLLLSAVGVVTYMLMKEKKANYALNQEFQLEKNDLENGIKTSVSQLLVEIEQWEQTYVFISPIDGRVAFTNYWTTNQNVTVGENIFTIIPCNSQEMIGKAKMPVARSGKVVLGQRVNIHFTN